MDRHSSRRKDPLEGKTLEMIVGELVAFYGWETMGREIKINCFLIDPSVSSSLKFLRRTPWARAKVEDMYRYYLQEKQEQDEKEHL